MKSYFATAACVIAVIGTSAGTAFAGEVKGPPGTGPRTQAEVDAIRTAAPSHSNSICSYSGSPGQDVRNGGAPGLPGLFCHGGSNPENP
jgi:hypothetical protein